MSTIGKLEAIQIALTLALEDVKSARGAKGSDLVAFRHVLSARGFADNAAKLLAELDAELEPKAVDEWEKISEARKAK